MSGYVARALDIVRRDRVNGERLAAKPLTPYEQGYIRSMADYAVWKDGVQLVGVQRLPLDEAVAEFLREHRGVGDR